MIPIHFQAFGWDLDIDAVAAINVEAMPPLSAQTVLKEQQQKKESQQSSRFYHRTPPVQRPKSPLGRFMDIIPFQE